MPVDSWRTFHGPDASPRYRQGRSRIGRARRHPLSRWPNYAKPRLTTSYKERLAEIGPLGCGGRFSGAPELRRMGGRSRAWAKHGASFESVVGRWRAERGRGHDRGKTFRLPPDSRVEIASGGLRRDGPVTVEGTWGKRCPSAGHGYDGAAGESQSCAGRKSREAPHERGRPTTGSSGGRAVGPWRGLRGHSRRDTAGGRPFGQAANASSAAIITRDPAAVAGKSLS